MTTLCRSLLAPLRLFLRQSLAVQVLEGLLAGLVVGLWLLALLAVLLLPLGFPAWQDASLFRPSLLEAPKQLNLLELFIPVNPFEAFATTQIPAVVLFSLCLGIALIGVPARQNLISILDRLSDGLLAISAFVARFTPIGVFAILAGTTAQVSAAEIPRLGIYLFLQGGIVLLFTLVVLPQLIAACTPIGAGRLLRCFRTPLTIAFATANLFVVLPLLVEQGKRLIVEARIERRGGQTEAMPQSNRRAMEAELEAEVELPVEVLTPLALVFPDMGRLLSLAFVPFAGWLNGNPMPLAGVPEFLMTDLALAPTAAHAGADPAQPAPLHRCRPARLQSPAPSRSTAAPGTGNTALPAGPRTRRSGGCQSTSAGATGPLGSDPAPRCDSVLHPNQRCADGLSQCLRRPGGSGCGAGPVVCRADESEGQVSAVGEREWWQWQWQRRWHWRGGPAQRAL